MSLSARVLAAALGAGVLFTGAGTALAAPTDETASDATTSDATEDAAGASEASDSSAPTGDGSLAPHPGGTSTGVLPGVAAPLPDPTLGVPEVLRVAITPLALLADIEGAQGSAPSENGAQGSPGSTEV